jgi:predicted nucleic acid-binding protein
MNGLAFFDTSVLIYADDASAPRKQSRAISLQMMQEYSSAVTKKPGVDPELAQRKVQLPARGRVVRFEADDVIAAIELHRLTRISF